MTNVQGIQKEAENFTYIKFRNVWISDTSLLKLANTIVYI